MSFLYRGRLSAPGKWALLAVLASVPTGRTHAQTISTYAGDGGVAYFCCVSNPSKIALDSDGDFYVSDSLVNKVFRITPRGIMTIVAGSGVKGYDGDGSDARSAKLNSPGGICRDRLGNLFIADSGNMVIRKVAPTGAITTVAGNGTQGDGGDGGQAINAQMDLPEHVVVDAEGNLFVAEYGGNRVRRVAADGTISTLAGAGPQGYAGDGGPAINAQLNRPGGVALSSAGEVYVADTFNNRVRKVSKSGVISTIAGDGTAGYTGDNGAASASRLFFPESVFLDAADHLYVTDTANHVLREVSAGIIRTIAGDGYEDVDGEGRYAGDGGDALHASFDFPTDVVVDLARNIYIADAGNRIVRRILPSGRIGGVFPGPGYEGDGGLATAAQVGAIDAAVDHAGNLYLADFDTWRIRKVSPDKVITSAASLAMFGFEDGGAYVPLSFPEALTVDDAGNLYVIDRYAVCVRKVLTDGSSEIVAGSCDGGGGLEYGAGAAKDAHFNFPQGIAVDAQGSIYIADTGNNVVRKVTNGFISTIAGGGTGDLGDGGPATAARLISPKGLAVDRDGNVYVADKFNVRVREILVDGTIRTVAGGGPTGQNGDGGPATAADLGSVVDVALDRAGNLYIADGSQRIRKVTHDGTISTVAGSMSGGYSGDGGLATNAELHGPMCITVDDDDNLYICDFPNRVVRKVTVNAIPSSVNLNQHGLTGSWYNPATGGQGLELEIYPDFVSPGQAFVFGGWFTFDAAATGEQRWYALEGSTSLTGPLAQLGIYSGFGGDFSAPPTVYAQPQGNASIEFADCMHGTLTYAFFDGRRGSIPLTRLTANTTCSAAGDTSAAASDYLLSGSWYDARFGGQGAVFDINPAQHVFFSAWYTYALDANQPTGAVSQRWYVMQADMESGTRALKAIPVYTARNGVFDNSAAPTATQVGTANVTFTTCSTAVLEYAFSAGENAGRTGTLNLTRTGPVPHGCTL